MPAIVFTFIFDAVKAPRMVNNTRPAVDPFESITISAESAA